MELRIPTRKLLFNDLSAPVSFSLSWEGGERGSEEASKKNTPKAQEQQKVQENGNTKAQNERERKNLHNLPSGNRTEFDVQANAYLQT